MLKQWDVESGRSIKEKREKARETVGKSLSCSYDKYLK